MKKEIHIWKLTDAKNDELVVVTNAANDCGCIYGYDKNGNLQQWNSYELCYAFKWAQEHGMKLEYCITTINITNEMFKK